MNIINTNTKNPKLEQLDDFIREQISFAFDDILESKHSNLLYSSFDTKSILDFIQNEVSNGKFTDLSEFEIFINNLYQELLDYTKKFHSHRQKMILRMKQEALEIAISSILFDIERLSDLEREQFNKKYGKFIEQITSQDSSQINFKLISIDKVIETQFDLLNYLQERDDKWFKNFRD